MRRSHSDSIQSTFEEQLEKYGQIVYTNQGVSMLPLLRENRDLIVIDRKGEGRCKKHDAVLYKRSNGQYVLHRILEVRQEDYVIAGDNCWQKESGITDKDILGVLAAVVRDGKEISVNNKGYQIYVHLWCEFFPIRAFLLKIRSRLGAWKRGL